MTEEEIITSSKMAHDELSESYYSGKSGMDKAAFDRLHAQNWFDMNEVLIAGGFRSPPVPVRDLAAELDQVKARVGDLEKRR